MTAQIDLTPEQAGWLLYLFDEPDEWPVVLSAIMFSKGWGDYYRDGAIHHEDRGLFLTVTDGAPTQEIGQFFSDCSSRGRLIFQRVRVVQKSCVYNNDRPRVKYAANS